MQFIIASLIRNEYVIIFTGKTSVGIIHNFYVYPMLKFFRANIGPTL